MVDALALWTRYKSQLFVDEDIGISLDISRMDMDAAFFASTAQRAHDALAVMAAVERGVVANPDEQRMVGHYWLRAPSLAPTAEIRGQIERALVQIDAFAADVHAGTVRTQRGAAFQNLLVVGIGGSALGPQLVSEALGSAHDRMRPYFFDNTDPDGMDNVLLKIARAGGLEHTLTLVISKSGGTKETRNGMLEAHAAYRAAGLDPAKHTVAVTGVDSELDKLAKTQGWLARFEMWDWVGGRTSELCAVGLLPAALQGLNIKAMLDGARAMDVLTRRADIANNPALLLALAWFKATEGKGKKDMVVLPYKDRLVLLSKYLQQLLMESLGKEKDLDGNVVHQGIAVYGNKGSTDQHAYVQQLRDGVPNFFATFIEVQADRVGASMHVEPGVTSGDFLLGFMLGTRRALYEGGRHSVTVTLSETSPRHLGAVIALYERAVGFYASFVNINAYHQPGVEAGKKAAQAVIAVQHDVVAALSTQPRTLEQICAQLGANADVETAFKVLEHLAANARVHKLRGSTPFNATYAL